MIIYLDLKLLLDSSDLPRSKCQGYHLLYLAVLQIGFTLPFFVTKKSGSLLHYLFTLTINIICLLMAVIFCGTFHCLTASGCYPVSFPVEFGLSSCYASDHSIHSSINLISNSILCKFVSYFIFLTWDRSQDYFR